MKKEQTGGHIIQSIDRALSILLLFDDQTEELNLSDIAAAMGLNVSTTYGLVNTLLQREFLAKNAKNGRYLLGREMLTPRYVQRQRVEDLLMKESNWYLHNLCSTFASTMMLFSYKNTILTNLKNVTPFPCDFSPIVTYNTSVSARIAMTQWSEKEIRDYFAERPIPRFTEYSPVTVEQILEKVEETKKNGYSTEMNEVDPGWGAYAVGIYDPSHKIIGTFSLNTTIENMVSNKEEITAAMLKASRQITQEVCRKLTISE